MKKLLLLLPLLFLLTSCFQEELVYTLNPDGSGKVNVKITFPLDSYFDLNLTGENTLSPEKKAQQVVKKALEQSEGIAAWTNVSYKTTDDNEIEFQGIAYFKDVNKVKINLGNIDSDTLTPTFTKKKGVVTVTCPLDKNVETEDVTPSSKKKKVKWADMSQKQQKQALAKTRRALTQFKGMLIAMDSDMSTQVTIQLPAPAQKTTLFKKLTHSSFTITQTGKMIIQGVDQVLSDEKILQRMAEDDSSMKNNPPAEVATAMFGSSDTPSLQFSASAPPAFDYKKEVTAALKQTPAMIQKLGIKIKIKVPPITSVLGIVKFKSLRLAGFSVVTNAPDRKVSPFNQSAGMSVAFIGELPGSVLSVKEGKITSFILNNGQKMLSGGNLFHKIPSIDLNEDGTIVGFNIKSDQCPKPDATSIKILKGEIICATAKATKITDLGFSQLMEGQKSKHFGAEIKSIKKSQYFNGEKEITIHFDLKKEAIKEVSFFDKDGTQLKSSQRGYTWSGDNEVLKLLCNDTLSKDGKIKVEVYTDLRHLLIPFTVKNTPLIPKQPVTKQRPSLGFPKVPSGPSPPKP